MSRRGIAEAITKLRQGAGVENPKNIGNLDDELRQIWNIPPEMETSPAMARIRHEMIKLAEHLDAEAKLIFEVAFKLHHTIQDRMLEDRRKKLCTELRISERTLRSREDAAIAQAASYLHPEAEGPKVAVETPREQTSAALKGIPAQESPCIRNLCLDGWYWEDLSVRVARYNPSEWISVYEKHRIIVTRGGLDKLGLLLYMTTFDEVGQELLLHGGINPLGLPDILTPLSEGLVHRLIGLPRAYSAGERIELFREIRLARNSPCYTFTPLHRCDRFDINFSFEAASTDEMFEMPTVYSIPGVPSEIVRDFVTNRTFQTGGEVVPAISFSREYYCWPSHPIDQHANAESASADKEQHQTIFEKLLPGLTYGLAWRVTTWRTMNMEVETPPAEREAGGMPLETNAFENPPSSITEDTSDTPTDLP